MPYAGSKHEYKSVCMNSMIKKKSFRESRDLLLSHIVPVETEKLPLDRLFGRILAEDVKA